MALCIRPNSTFPPEIGGIVGARPALARLNRFEGTTSGVLLKKGFFGIDRQDQVWARGNFFRFSPGLLRTYIYSGELLEIIEQ